MTTSTIQAPATQHTMRKLNVYFCAWAVAGVRTQYENVRSVAAGHDDVAIHYVEINPYKAGGLIERIPWLGNRTKGSLRSLACTLPLFRERPIDAIWTQADTSLFPFLATRARLAAIPYVLSTDATTTQVESFAEYGLAEAPGRKSLKHRLRDQIAAHVYQHAAYVLPWSQWAADGIMAEFGVPASRIRVAPPGVDVRAWPMRATSAEVETERRLTRLLFVGGDFARKGGPLLLEVFRTQLRGRCELYLVTKEPVEREQGVYIYDSFGPNDPGLHHLYEICDALVLPTRADCFSLASIEAMASGLPVITCPVGGIPEVVEDGASGWLVPVGDGQALHAAIEALLADPARAQAMGRRGRAIAEQRFDAAKNTNEVFALLRGIKNGGTTA